MREKLAIIIPAYKRTFLIETLDSLAKQTCKDFTLYIGDDASPHDLAEIINNYRSEITIVYKRFEKNLGSQDLVAHWERCIDMSLEEQWIWLFSDDDIMHPTCVEIFYNHIKNDKSSELLHFNIEVIDGKGKKKLTSPSFPPKMSAADFFQKRIKGEIYSFVVEYIFARRLYVEKKGFQKFDLAWCTDDATWIKFATNSGITTLEGASRVYWRYSEENISAMNVDESILDRKTNARVSFLFWTKDFFDLKKLKPDLTLVDIVRWTLLDIKAIRNYPFLKRLLKAFRYGKKVAGFSGGILGILYITYLKLKGSIK